MDAETAEAEETMLPWSPFERGRDGYASKSIFFDKEVRFLATAVFEEGTEPGVGPAGDVDCCCGDEIVPEKRCVSHFSGPVG